MQYRISLRRFALVCVGLIAIGAALMPGAAQADRRGANHFPNVTVRDQDGRKLSFYDDVIKGRRVVISFIYTSCTDICPLTTARLTQVADELGEAMGRDVFFVSLSVDPVNDTPEKLKAHAEAFHVGPGWLFITGTLENMRAVNGAFGERMRALNEHRNEVVLGNDTTGEWARNTVFGDLGRLAFDIRAMDPAWRPDSLGRSEVPFREVSQSEVAPAGQSLFKRLCAGCHSLGVRDRVGPDLMGVTQRRSPDWLTRFIVNPQRMHKERDQTALALAKKFPAVRMPSFNLSETDAGDLIGYLASRTEWLMEQRRQAAAEAGSHANHNHDHQHHQHHNQKHDHGPAKEVTR